MFKKGKKIGLGLSGKPGAAQTFKPGFVFVTDVAQMVLLLLMGGPQQQPLNVATADSPSFQQMVIEAHKVFSDVLEGVQKGSEGKKRLKPLSWDKREDAPMISVDV